jgi:hypothetical protein
MLEDDEPEQHTPWDPKNTFLGVEFDVVRSEFRKSFLRSATSWSAFLDLTTMLSM